MQSFDTSATGPQHNPDRPHEHRGRTPGNDGGQTDARSESQGVGGIIATDGYRRGPAYRSYLLSPAQVSADLRDSLLAAYPNLQGHQHSWEFRRMAEHVLFAPSHARLDRSHARDMIFPYDLVAALVGRHPKSKGFSAAQWITEFGEWVFALNPSVYRYSEAKARTVRPEIKPEIRQAIQQDVLSLVEMGKVTFVNGIRLTRQAKRDLIHQHDQFLKAKALSVPPSEPSYELLQYLTLRPKLFRDRVLDCNWPRLLECFKNLPSETERQQATRDYCARVLHQLALFRHIYYMPGVKTCRLYSQGATVLQLPRALRKAAFAGEHELDIRACQLAVVAAQWHIPELQDFLRSGDSIWAELLGFMEMPLDFKPIVKSTLYSIIFGMSINGRRRTAEDVDEERATLKRNLEYGDQKSDGVGPEATERFFRHPLIQQLLKARGHQLSLIWKHNGAMNAYGRWKSLPSHREANGEADSEQKRREQKAKACKELLASVVQSYEFKLMSSVLPVLKAEPQIYVSGWLHDGVTVHLGNRTKQARHLRLMQDAVKEQAGALGMATFLEHTAL